MDKILDYLMANPKVLTFILTAIGQLVVTIVALLSAKKSKEQKATTAKNAFEEVGMNGRAVDILTLAGETSDAKPFKAEVNRLSIGDVQARGVIEDSINVARVRNAAPDDAVPIPPESFEDFANRMLRKK